MPESANLQPTTLLTLPMSKRVLVQFNARHQVLTVFAGDKEISFDEPELFGFARTLATQRQFEAQRAVSWGQGLDWPRVQALLQTLVEEDVLWREADARLPALAAVESHAPGARPSPLPIAPRRQAASWRDCEFLTQALTGRALSHLHLEVAVPVYRVAHMAMDADGRQVGEANVFPKELRVEVPTQWRACLYRGDRYQGERPMNVSALKALRDHWTSALALLLAMRDTFLAREPLSPRGWTVGQLERFTVAVLAWPAYWMQAADGAAAEDVLPGPVSTLYRITDGLRGVTHQMMFVALHEPSWSPDAPVTALDLLDYAERNHLFHSPTGVCAGPQNLIETFLAVALDGEASEELRVAKAVQAEDPAWTDWLAMRDDALDYAYAGLMTHAAAYVQWPGLTQAHAEVRETLETLVDGAQRSHGLRAAADSVLQVWLARARQHQARIDEIGHLATAALRLGRSRVYAHIHARSARALGLECSESAWLKSFAPRVADHPRERTALLQALLRCCSPVADALSSAWVELADAILSHALRVQASLRWIQESQAMVATLLNRSELPSGRDLEGRDLDITHRLAGHFPGRLPCLLQDLEDQLGLHLRVTAERIDVHATPLVVPADSAAPANTPDPIAPVAQRCPFHPASLATTH